MPTKGPLAALHVAKAQLGMPDESYREILRQLGNVESAKDLTPQAYRVIMRRMNRLGWRSTSKRHFGDRAGMASDAELGKIKREWLSYAPDDANFKGLRTWLERRWKVSDLRFVTADQAPKVIAAVNAMAAWRQRKDAEGRAP